VTPQQAIEAARTNPAAFTALYLRRALDPFQLRVARHRMLHPRFHLELPRGHGKTVGGALYEAWQIGNDPTIRIQIVGSTDDEAVKTCKMIRDIVKSPTFRAVFPHVAVEEGYDNNEFFRVRHSVPAQRDNTVEAVGVLGNPGGRKDRIWFDDICTLKNSVLQPKVREQIKEAVNSTWPPMLDYGAGNHAKLAMYSTGTPWHPDDANAMLRRKAEARGDSLRLPCVGTRSPWPESFPPEVLERERDPETGMGMVGYARAYELVPLNPELMVFQPGWLLGHLWSGEPPIPARVIAAVDWAYSAKSAEKPDPDWSVCQVARIDGYGHTYAMELLRVREPLPDFRRKVAALCERHGVTTVYAEGNGPQDGAVQELRATTRIPVVGLDRNRDKHWRAIEVQSYIESGKYHLPAGSGGQVRPDFQIVFDEVAGFPAATHDDTLDTVIDLCREAMRCGGSVKEAVQVVENGPGGVFRVPARSSHSGLFARGQA